MLFRRLRNLPDDPMNDPNYELPDYDDDVNVENQIQRPEEVIDYPAGEGFRNVVLYEKGPSTEKAILVSTGPMSEDAEEFWIPKSQCKHIHRDPPKEGDYRRCVYTLPEWLLAKKGL